MEGRGIEIYSLSRSDKFLFNHGEKFCIVIILILFIIVFNKGSQRHIVNLTYFVSVISLILVGLGFFLKRSAYIVEINWSKSTVVFSMLRSGKKRVVGFDEIAEVRDFGPVSIHLLDGSKIYSSMPKRKQFIKSISEIIDSSLKRTERQ